MVVLVVLLRVSFLCQIGKTAEDEPGPEMARVKDHEVFLWSRNPDENDFLIQRIASKVRAAEGDCRGRSGYSVQIRTLNLRHSKT